MKPSCKIESFNIKITNKGIFREDYKSFSGISFTCKEEKLYVVTFNKEFIYVGQTKQKIGDKFRQSFRSYMQALKNKKDKSGYSGYKWIGDFIKTKSVLTLNVIRFDWSKINKTETITRYTKAIEAELAFEIRKNKGRWPLNQNEIHFFNDFENANEIAKGIYNALNN